MCVCVCARMCMLVCMVLSCVWVSIGVFVCGVFVCVGEWGSFLSLTLFSMYDPEFTGPLTMASAPYAGEHCKKIDLTIEQLYRATTSPPTVKIVNITNGLI